MSEDIVRSISSSRPFHQSAFRYFENGFLPMPLPAGEKYPPPTGFTGRRSGVVDMEQISEWSAEKANERANVGLHLSLVRPSAEAVAAMPEGPEGGDGEGWFDKKGNPRYGVIGIDVDHYEEKKGLETLHRAYYGGEGVPDGLEPLGELPDTWTSSARSNGIAGIRYFLTPAEYSYRGGLGGTRKNGKISGFGPSVDVIQRSHRYAVVWPSAHPEAGQYHWYEPGVAPDGVSHASEVPKAWLLPVLPSAWVRYLSQGGLPFTQDEVDMEVSLDDLFTWSKKKAGQDGGPTKIGSSLEEALDTVDEVACSLLRKRVRERMEEIASSDDSHNPLIWSHWELFRAGILQGHSGWLSAVGLIDLFWSRHVLGAGDAQIDGEDRNGKRDMEQVRGEVFRSRSMALRKIKAEIDTREKEQIELGGKVGVVVPQCGCYEETDDGGGGAAGGHGSFNLRAGKDPSEYERTDDGNAEHFLDILGEDFRYVPEAKKWIYFSNEEVTDRFGLTWSSGEVGGRWIPDKKGLSRQAWRAVQRRQRGYANHLARLAAQADAADSPDAKELKEKARKWRDWADRSGNNLGAKNALEAAQSFAGVSVGFEEINHDRMLLGVSNGVLELHRGKNGAGSSYSLRPGTAEDMITKNTGVPFLPLDKQIAGDYGPRIREGALLWKDYLNTFLNNLELRAWVQQLMGYCLLGLNEKRKLIFLYGKSSTGKSTMLDAVMSAVGEYGSSETMELFSTDIKNPQLVHAVDNRIVTMSEIEDGDKKVSAAMLKKMGSTDVAKARELNSNEFIEKKVAFTAVIATNSPPPVDRTDGALERRIVVVPFNHSVSKQEEDPEKGAAIPKECAAAVLSWMVEGWAMYCNERLGNEPIHIEEVKDADEQFKNEMSPLGDFISEWLERTGNPEDEIPNSVIYSAYDKYCEEQKIERSRRWSMQKMSNELRSAGIESGPKAKRFDDFGMQRYKVAVRMKKDAPGGKTYKIVRA